LGVGRRQKSGRSIPNMDVAGRLGRCVGESPYHSEWSVGGGRDNEERPFLLLHGALRKMNNAREGKYLSVERERILLCRKETLL